MRHISRGLTPALWLGAPPTRGVGIDGLWDETQQIHGLSPDSLMPGKKSPEKDRYRHRHTPLAGHEWWLTGFFYLQAVYSFLLKGSECFCTTGCSLHWPNVKYSYPGLFRLSGTAERLRLCRGDTRSPWSEPSVTLKASHQAKLHSQLSDSAPCQEVWVTAGVRWGRYRMYTHTRTCPARAILYRVWKAITPWQEAYRTNIHCSARSFFVRAKSDSGQLGERKRLF